jgi:hypothetical protein
MWMTNMNWLGRICSSMRRRPQAAPSVRSLSSKEHASRTSRKSAVSRVRRQQAAFGHFERMESRDVLSVTFHGGQLLSQVEAQPVYLGSDWSANSALHQTEASIDQFVSYLVQSPYMDMLNQAGYNVGRGTETSGKELNVNINKTTGITDGQIQADLQAAITSGTLSAPDANRLYVVYVEPSVLIKLGGQTSQNSFLGYHGAFAGTDTNGKATDIHYAVMAYPGSPNPSSGSQGFSSAFAQLTSVTSHELAEAVTDPNVNYKAAGWYDDRLNGEIGDLTRQTSILNGYLVQDVVNKNDQTIAPTAAGGSGSTGGSGGVNTLSAPQGVSATALSPTSAQLTWQAVTGTAGYRIFLINGSQSTLLGTVASSRTSVSITGLSPGANESFKVEAYSGTAVADSAVVSVAMPSQAVPQPPQAVPQSPAAPQVTITTIASNTVQLSWGSVSGAQGYRIYWWNGTQAVLLGTVGASATSVRVTGLTGGMTARFMVESFNGSSVADSAWATITTASRARNPWSNWWSGQI